MRPFLILFFQSHILHLSFKLILLSFVVLILFLVSLFSGSVFFPPLFDTFTFEKVETHFRHFCFFPIRPRAQFYPENSFPWSFVANTGEIEERIKLPRDQVTLVCLERFYRSCRPREIVFFSVTARFLFRHSFRTRENINVLFRKFCKVLTATSVL